MIEVNLQGLLYIAHAALLHLLRAAEREPRRVADLVNVSSVAGRRVGAGGGIYQLIGASSPSRLTHVLSTVTATRRS
jgi:NAD(P)-dependent dehydrogenase (short-subunit alcohol dehydrogenase family)